MRFLKPKPRQERNQKPIPIFDNPHVVYIICEYLTEDAIVVLLQVINHIWLASWFDDEQVNKAGHKIITSNDKIQLRILKFKLANAEKEIKVRAEL